MAGKIKRMLDSLIEQQSGGVKTTEHVVRTKLILKGINPNKFTETSDDDPALIAKITQLAAELGVKL